MRPAATSRGNATTTLLVYSWQQIRHIAGGTDGARHAGMAQRLVQVVRCACRLGMEVVFLSGQPMARPTSDEDRERGQAYVGGCRITHYYGSTASQHARMAADGVQPLFAFIFYTAAWFAIEQRALRNTSGWSAPEAYLDEEASLEGGLGGKESKLLSCCASSSRTRRSRYLRTTYSRTSCG